MFGRRASRPEQRSPQLGLKASDLSVLKVLLEQGANLHEPRHVLHFCDFPHQQAAEQAAASARAEGWEVATRASAPARWSMIAERQDAVLLPPFVRDSTDFFDRLAAEHDGAYDGWEAST